MARVIMIMIAILGSLLGEVLIILYCRWIDDIDWDSWWGLRIRLRVIIRYLIK